MQLKGLLNEEANKSMPKDKISQEVDKYTRKECGKKFNCAAHVKRHEVTHTGAKPFSCNYCKKSFATKWNRDSHEKKIHNQATKSAVDQALKSTNNEYSTGDKRSIEDESSIKNKDSTEDKKY